MNLWAISLSARTDICLYAPLSDSLAARADGDFVVVTVAAWLAGDDDFTQVRADDKAICDGA